MNTTTMNTTTMKLKIIIYTVLFATLIIGCKDDDESTGLDLSVLNTENIQGSWKITTALGTEWTYEEGKGVKGTEEVDDEFLNETISITADKLILSADKSASYKLDVAKMTFSLLNGDGSLDTQGGIFDIASFDGDTMQLNNIDPTKESDYEDKGGDFPKYYQKKWTLTRK